jgi:Na+/H+ antiporter NhaD/arsenite permease-like protein
MLWIGGQISAINIMTRLFIPSLVSLVVPLIYLSFKMKGQTVNNQPVEDENFLETTAKERNIMFFVGLGTLLFVPIFKTLTHLPPYMGMMFGLGLVWVVGEILHSKKDEDERKPFTASYALSRIDSSSILFFLGILLAIGCLESTGLLQDLAKTMNESIGNQDIIILLIGLASSIVDNVPLVAAAMGMYDLTSFPADHKIWEFLAYCAGTGGSILIIGSAAGVAVMGMEKIDFLWYLKRISLLALLGYFAGAGMYLLAF